MMIQGLFLNKGISKLPKIRPRWHTFPRSMSFRKLGTLIKGVAESLRAQDRPQMHGLPNKGPLNFKKPSCMPCI